MKMKKSMAVGYVVALCSVLLVGCGAGDGGSGNSTGGNGGGAPTESY